MDINRIKINEDYPNHVYFFLWGGGEGKKTEVQSKETGERRIKSNNSHK